MTMKRYALTLVLLMIIPFLAGAQNQVLQNMIAGNQAATIGSAAVHDDPAGMEVSVQKLIEFADAWAARGSKPMQCLENASIDREMTLLDAARLTKGESSPAVVGKRTVKSATRAAAAKAVIGGYIAKDLNYKGSKYYSSMKLFKDDEGNYKMANVYGAADTISITLDLENGTVTIPSQKFYTHATYGDIWLYPINVETLTYNSKGSVTGTIDENGEITLSSWCLLCTGEKYAGRAINIFKSSVWTPANATIKSINTEGTETSYDGLIEQTSENELTIYNFANTGYPVSAVLTSQGAVKVSPQQVGYSASLAGAVYFFCYPANLTTNKISMTEPIVGAGTSSSITFGNWVICQRNYSAGVLKSGKFTSTVINTTLNIKYPEAKEIKFEGSGTSASPYLIKTADDLMMLAEAVNNGESYKGQYFKQTANISLSSITSAYQPVGDSSAPFEGTYDGGSHAVTDLTMARNGFSNSGVFGYIGTSGTVKNLYVKSTKITSLGSNVGLVAGSNYGLISNCVVSESTITASSDAVGGIAGYNEGTVSDCSFDGTLSNSGDTGGMVGFNIGNIANCDVKGTLNVNGYYSDTYHSCGGIVGYTAYTASATSKVTDSFFAGQLLDASGYARIGGVAGSSLHTVFERCFNVGTVYQGADGSSYVAVGGFTGLASAITVTDCYNAGLITKVGKSKRVGGLTGYLSLSYSAGTGISGWKVENTSTFKNFYNSGLINASTVHAKSCMYGECFVVSGVDPADDMFTNCYSDIQTTGLDSSEYSKPTSFFTSGTLPEGFSSDVWTAESGLYPVLKEFANSDASKLSAAVMQLANNENARKVKSTITLNTPSNSDVKWALSNSGTYVTSTDGLTLTGNTAVIKDIYSSEVITAYVENGSMSKSYIVAVVPKVFDGEGTESSPYLIKTVADFEKLSNAVAVSHQPHEGDYFKMTNDIDFTGSDFVGVNGNTTYFFSGTFDGDNHYIHNFNLNTVVLEDGKATTKSTSYAGLFGVCSVKSTVKNLRMASDNTFMLYSYSAPIVGYTLGKVINCRNYADVIGANQYVAGVVGAADSIAVVSGCYNAGHIQVASAGGAGIVAYALGDTKTELCQNDGRIEGVHMDISGTKDGNQNTVAGIVSYSSGIVDRCVNNGTISAYKNVGGITATSTHYYDHGDITNCINNGIVICKLSTDVQRGAMIGNLVTKGEISNNYYDASVVTYGAARNVALNGVTGLSTSEMVSGTALSGLSDTDFSFKANAYPVLKAFEDEAASVALRSIYVGFGKGEIRENVVKNTSLSADSNIKWSLVNNKNFTITDGMLNVAVPTDMTVAEDTLTAVYGDSARFTKVYYLRSVPVILDGAGTADNPFQIKSKEDMNKLAEFIESSGMEYEGYYFKVMNDIDYAGDSLKLIATGAINFKGDFDGNGKTIKGYVYENSNAKTGKYLAMFANVGSSGVIHDLTVDGTFKGHSYAGGIVSKLYGKMYNCVNKGTVATLTGMNAGGLAYATYEGAKIYDSHNEGDVTAKTSYAAGIASLVSKGSSITNCYNTGAVTSVSSYCAGIASSCSGTITDCYNEGSLSGKGTVGGIVGLAGTTDTIINCYNKADITLSSGGTVGGIVASVPTKATNYIKNCYNTGHLKATGSIGGIGGNIQSGTVVENCYNTGNVSAVSTGKAGGLFGSISGSTTAPTTLSDCYNTGDVSNYNKIQAGGLAGYLYGVTVNDCYNLGDVTVTAASTAKIYAFGGLAGSASGSTFNNCWNSGDIDCATHGVGGIAGTGSGTANGCANYGDITCGNVNSTGYYTGGIWGYLASKVTNCINMGDITAVRAAGLYGMANAGTSIKNTYTAGSLNVSGESDKSSNVAWFQNATAVTKFTGEKIYFDSKVNKTELAYDSLFVGLPTQEMFRADLGDGFEYHKGAYPTNPNFKEYSVPNYFAANVEFIAVNDSAGNVTDKFYVGALKGVTITSSSNIQINDSIATPTALGEGWITFSTDCHGEHFEKTFNLTITKLSGVGDVLDGGKTVTARSYYDINGIKVANPVAGRFYVVKSQYSDGTSSVKKIFFKE